MSHSGDTVKFDNGYFMAPNDIFDFDLKIHDKIVYLYLCRCGNNSTAFPSYNTIAKKCSISRRKAIYVVDNLKGLKLLKKQIRKSEDDSKNMSNVYEVVPPSESDAPLGELNAPRSEQDAPNKELAYKQSIYKEHKEKGANRDFALSFYAYKSKYSVDEESNEVIEYYLECYHSHQKKAHPNLKAEQWQKVINDLYYGECNKPDGYEEFTGYELKYIIDQHFKTKYKDCDYNIMHFISGQIRALRYYELGCY